MSIRSLLTGSVCALLFVAAFAASPAGAGIDIDLGASIRLGDNTDVYLAVSSRYFEKDRHVVDGFAVRYHDPDDLAVALFLARHSRRSDDHIWGLRQRGFSWWEISVRLGVPTDVWFVEVPRDPGPPYGKAYGHWKNHKRNRHHHVVLADVDARNLVAVRLLHEYYGVSAQIAMEWRSSGSDLRVLVSSEYQRRHGKPDHARKPTSHKTKPGKGNPHKNK